MRINLFQNLFHSLSETITRETVASVSFITLVEMTSTCGRTLFEQINRMQDQEPHMFLYYSDCHLEHFAHHAMCQDDAVLTLIQDTLTSMGLIIASGMTASLMTNTVRVVFLRQI